MLAKAMFASVLVICLMVSYVTPNAVPFESKLAKATGSNRFTVGYRVAGDYLLSQQVISKSSKWLSIVTQDFTVLTPNYQTITMIDAIDQKTNGNGAYASLTKGGPGSRNATLHFKSQRGHGISYLVQVYGR